MKRGLAAVVCVVIGIAAGSTLPAQAGLKTRLYVSQMGLATRGGPGL